MCMHLHLQSRGTSETKANGGKSEHQEMIKPDSSDDVKPFEGALAKVISIFSEAHLDFYHLNGD